MINEKKREDRLAKTNTMTRWYRVQNVPRNCKSLPMKRMMGSDSLNFVLVLNAEQT